MKETFKKGFRKVALFPKSVLGFLGKDFILLYRKKRYLYLSLALPLIIGLIYIFTLIQAGPGISVFVCDFDDTDMTKNMLSSLEGYDIHIAKTNDYANNNNCTTNLIQNIKEREYLFGVVIERGFTDKISSLTQSRITVYYDNSDPSIAGLASWKIDTSLTPYKIELVMTLAKELKEKSSQTRKQTTATKTLINSFGYTSLSHSISQIDYDLARIESIDPGFLAVPIISDLKGVHKEFDLVEIGFAPLFVILSLFIVFMLCSTGVIYDRKSGLFARIRASNSSMLAYIIAKVLMFGSLVVLQFAVIFLIFFAFGARFDINFILLLKALFFIAVVDTLIGYIIGLISDSEGLAVLISLIITLPMFFLSGMFYPVELLPSFIQVLGFGLHIEVLMMKEALLFGGAINNYLFLVPLGLLLFCQFLSRRR